jgi:hypothetical protein
MDILWILLIAALFLLTFRLISVCDPSGRKR